MIFNGWGPLLRVIAVGVPAYIALIFFLRISGKRTLSKMNAFDLVVTIAIGSTFATILLSSSVSLVEGLTAFIVLIILQYVVAWLAVRSKQFSSLIKAEPALLFYQGEYLDKAMKVERVTAGEVRAAVRAEGVPDLDRVAAVVLETDGSFTVITNGGQKPYSVLAGVKRERSSEHS